MSDLSVAFKDKRWTQITLVIELIENLMIDDLKVYSFVSWLHVII